MNQMIMNNPNVSRDMTDADLSTHLGPVASRGAGGLHVQFFYARVRIENRDSEYNGQNQTRLCVAKQPVGDRYSIAIRYITEEQAKREFPVEFDKFKRFEEVPTSGTPLHELPGASQSQIGLLTLNGIRSIEDLASLSDDQANQIGYDAAMAYRLAKAWVARRDDAAESIKAAEVEAKAAFEREAMQKRLDSFEQANKALSAQVEALTRMAGSAAQPVEMAAARPAQPVEDLEYDVEKMPDPFADSGMVASGNDDLDLDQDPDPLR